MENNIQGVKDPRDPAKNGQEDVDEEVGIAASFQEDAEGREEYGGDDLDDVAATTLAEPRDKQVD
jgi:hypothetical protein